MYFIIRYFVYNWFDFAFRINQQELLQKSGMLSAWSTVYSTLSTRAYIYNRIFTSAIAYNCEHAIIDTGHVNVNIVDNDLLFCIANVRVGYQDAAGHQVQVGGLFLVLKHTPNLTLTILAEQVVGASYEYLNE